MRLPKIQLQLTVVLSCVALATLCAQRVSAQQVTYYNFDAPQATTNNAQPQFAFGCNNFESGPAAAGVLFCFNSTNPSTDPTFTQDPSPDYSILMTPAVGGQASSVWFSIPQDVADGFNVWFAFKLTPTSLLQNPPAGQSTPADGMAFVIQNAQGGGDDTAAHCSESGSGFTALGGTGPGDGGDCIGYGGIDNSVALELDTYANGSIGDPNSNHIALQSCGLGESSVPNANSPDHDTCTVVLQNNPATSTLIPNPLSASTGLPVTLSDGAEHQMVIVYNGPNDPNPNTISVYLDPTFVPTTHTPVASSVPLFSGPFVITNYINLSSNSPTSSPAYVGFTSGTGGSFEQQELMAWTFTPHATVSQQQPLNPPGTQTTANFGTHSYSTTFPAGNTSSTCPPSNPSCIGMGVIANTISPANFAALLGLGATQYTGSACQVYDDTGGNCIIYSTYCYDTTSKDVVACPTLTTPPIDCSNPSATDCVNVKSAYNNSIQPITAGYLQGDPLYSPITSISGNGTTATVTCVGECAVTGGQNVTILGNVGPPSFNGPIVVQSVVDISHFTFASSVNGSSNGGFLTSNNVQDIFTSYVPQNIDGSTGGKTQNFSDFVVTGVTVVSSQTKLSAASLSPAPGQSDLLTATVSTPMGPNNLPLLPLVSGGTVSFFANSIAISGCQSLTLSGGQATCSFTPLLTGPVTIQAQYSGDPYHQPSSTMLPLTVTGALANVSPTNINFGTLYVGSIVTKTITITNTGNAAMTISDPLIAFVGGVPSEFITLNLCPKSLAAGKSCLMTVTFIAGPFYTPQTATLNINDNAPGSPQTVSMTATVINPQAHLSANSLSFGAVKVSGGSPASKTLTLTNNGGTQLSTIGMAVTGANPGDFTLGSCPTYLNPGSSCTLGVTFKPGAKGSRTATLVITDNAQNSPQKVALSGTGN